MENHHQQVSTLSLPPRGGYMGSTYFAHSHYDNTNYIKRTQSTSTDYEHHTTSKNPYYTQQQQQQQPTQQQQQQQQKHRGYEHCTKPWMSSKHVFQYSHSLPKQNDIRPSRNFPHLTNEESLKLGYEKKQHHLHHHHHHQQQQQQQHVKQLPHLHQKFNNTTFTSSSSFPHQDGSSIPFQQHLHDNNPTLPSVSQLLVKSRLEDTTGYGFQENGGSDHQQDSSNQVYGQQTTNLNKDYPNDYRNRESTLAKTTGFHPFSRNGVYLDKNDTYMEDPQKKQPSTPREGPSDGSGFENLPPTQYSQNTTTLSGIENQPTSTTLPTSEYPGWNMWCMLPYLSNRIPSSETMGINKSDKSGMLSTMENSINSRIPITFGVRHSPRFIDISKSPKKRRERWTKEEHMKFLEGLEKYGRKWKKIQLHVQSKTAIQVRTHAYGYFAKLLRNIPEDENLWEVAEIMSSLPSAVLRGPGTKKKGCGPNTDDKEMKLLRKYVLTKSKKHTDDKGNTLGNIDDLAKTLDEERHISKEFPSVSDEPEDEHELDSDHDDELDSAHKGSSSITNQKTVESAGIEIISLENSRRMNQ